MLNNTPEQGEAINMSINESPPVVAQVPTDDWTRAVAADRRLTAIARLIALRLFLDDDHPTYEEIGVATGCGRRTAMRGVACLIDRGWLVKLTSTRGVPNSYGMTMRGVAS
jgi:hypothetical protein